MMRTLFLLALVLNVSWLSAQRFCGFPSFPQHTGCEHGLQGTGLYAPSFIPPPAYFDPNGFRESVISVSYTGFTPEAMNAFQYAVDIWATVVSSPVPVTVDANFQALNGNALGFAGATNSFRNFSGAPQNNVFYPTALANSLAGTELNPSSANIFCTFNSNVNWYYGTDGNTPSGQYDFVTVVLHELAHGLGFFGSVQQVEGSFTYGFLNSPFIYDTFVSDAAGQTLTAIPSSDSEAIAELVTSGNLLWTGDFGVGAGAPSPVSLFSPGNYQPGSSLSHLNESSFPAGSPNSLMTPFLNIGEAIHSPGPIVEGMFKDMGWTIGPCGVETIEVNSVSECNPETGTFTTQLVLTFSNPPSTGVLNVNGSVFPIGQSPRTINLTREADGAPLTITAFFSAQPECLTTFEEALTAPQCPCVGDFNNDSVVSSGDLLFILAEFGCVLNCTADINDDTVVNTADLLIFLSLFGNQCL